MHVCRLAIALTLLVAAPCFAAIQWSGDFESGNLSQWTGMEEVSTDRLQIVSDPVRQGKFALRVLVKQGDNPNSASGYRNELFQEGNTGEGTEAYYRWSTMFAPSFPSAEDWQLFAQWHQPEDCCGSPPIQFYVYGEEIRLTVSTAQTQVWQAPLKRGTWHDFVLHVRFSDDPKTGFVELWYDGQHVLPKTFAATRANDYLKLGLYRSTSIAQDGVLYQDGMTRADTLEDLMPPAPASGPAETPPATSSSPSSSASSGTAATGSPQASSGGSSADPSAGGCSATGSAPALALGLLGAAAMLRARRRRSNKL